MLKSVSPHNVFKQNRSDYTTVNFSAETTEIRPLQPGDFHLQTLLSGVNCSGSEKRLADCHHDGVDLADTTGCGRAFVRCLKQIPTPGMFFGSFL